jgi:hypothetical protein
MREVGTESIALVRKRIAANAERWGRRGQEMGRRWIAEARPVEKVREVAERLRRPGYPGWSPQCVQHLIDGWDMGGDLDPPAEQAAVAAWAEGFMAGVAEGLGRIAGDALDRGADAGFEWAVELACPDDLEVLSRRLLVPAGEGLPFPGSEISPAEVYAEYIEPSVADRGWVVPLGPPARDVWAWGFAFEAVRVWAACGSAPDRLTRAAGAP